MTRIGTNIESLRALRNYQKVNNLQSQSLQRLSTGVQINSGRDNPSGLIASETLRLQTTAIQQSISNSNRANNVISTADSALGEISGLLNQVRGLVQEGLNVGALSSAETAANQDQIDAALSAINRISSNTTFAGEKLIDGSKAFNTSVSAADAPKIANVQVNQALFGSNNNISLAARVTQVAEKAQLRYTAGATTAASQIEIQGNSGKSVVNLASGSDTTAITSAVNSVTDVTGVTARVANGLNVAKNAVANTLTTAVGGNNNDLVFTDARATTANGANATLGGAINVVYAVAGNNTALSVAVTTAGNGDKTITVNVATDANGAATSTAAQVTTAIQGNANASALVTVANASGNDGTGTVAALASTALTGGTDAATIRFVDARAAGTAGNVNVVFANGGNNQTLGVAVTTSGNDSTVTVNLGTNGSGVVTSTFAQIATALQNSTAASALVSVSQTGDSTATGVTQASTALAAATGDVVLESQDYGSAQIVGVSVLSGSFATVDAANTAASRDLGRDLGVTINGAAASTVGLKASVRSQTLDASITFTSAANVVNTTATTTITDGGALFQIGQDATSSGQVGIGIDAINTYRLGGTAGKLSELASGGGKSLQDIRAGLLGTGTKLDQNKVVQVIEDALEQVSSLRGRLGAVQKNVIETNISTLGVALENISSARSQIVDTDFAAETANLQKAQVLSQAGISVLTIANQTPQQVLALLRG